jgi:epsilon-lactone hydrolase
VGSTKNSAADRVLLCMHGGGFIGGSIYSNRKMFGHLAKATGARALLFDCRLAPEYTHPAQVDDATAVYRWLLDHGISADHIAFTGDSCGGGLAITTQLRARELRLPLPAAAMPFSPWVDMEATVESYVTNRDRDAFFSSGLVRGLAGIFLGEGGNPRDPLANPLYADLSGLGPIYIQAAGDEVLLDDARLLDEHARKAGVEVRLDVFPICSTPFRWPPVERLRPMRRSAEWPTGYDRSSTSRSSPATMGVSQPEFTQGSDDGEGGH